MLTPALTVASWRIWAMVAPPRPMMTPVVRVEEGCEDEGEETASVDPDTRKLG